MRRWFNEEKLIFGAAVLAFAAMVWHAQNGWMSADTGASGARQLEGASKQQSTVDSFAVAYLGGDFAAFSVPQGRNIFEPLDKMLPMPPVQLHLASLPAPKILVPLPQPNPPSSGQLACMVPADTTWAAAPAPEAPPEEGEGAAPDETVAENEEGGETGEAPEEPAKPEPNSTPEGGNEAADSAAWADERVRPYATVIFKSGKERQCTIIRELPDSIVVESPGADKLRSTLQRRDIDRIIPAKPLEELIREDFEAIKKTDDSRYQKLIERCLAPGAPPKVTALAEDWGLRVCRDATRRLDLYQLLAAHFRKKFDVERQLQVYEAARDAAAGILPIELGAEYADVLVQVGLPERARATVEAALLRKRNDEGLKLRLARYEVEQGAYDHAVTILRELGASALARPEVGIILARSLYLAGHFDEARDQLAPLTTSLETAAPNALLLLGACQLVLGDRAAARTTFTALVSQENAGGYLRGMGAYNLGVLAQLDRDAPAAQEHFATAASLDPTNASPYLGLGFLAEVAGTPEAAVLAYQQALATQPRLGYAHLALGRVAERTLSGDAAYQEPRSNYQLAFVEDFELTDAVARLGYLAARAGDSGGGHEHYYEALDYLAEAARRVPDDQLLRLEIAHCHIALAELDSAEEIFQQVQTADAENSDALAGIAYVHNAAGAERRALADLDKLAKRSGVRAELAEFARAGSTAISTNLGRWRWVDSFNRTGDVPRRKWSVVQEVGIRVYLDADAGAVRFAGTQSGDAPDAASRLEREIDPKTFVSFKAKIDTSAAGKATACVALRFADEKRPIELLWGRTAQGKLAWKITGSPKEADWAVISDYPSGDVHELGIRAETGQGKARYFILTLDGVVLRDESASIKSAQLTAAGGKNIRVGVCGAAAAYDEYRLLVDDVELVEERPAK